MMPVLLFLALTAAAPQNEAKPTAAALVGTWKAEAVVMDGERSEPRPDVIWTFTAEGQSVLRVWADDSMEGTYKADAAKDPPEIDISSGPKLGLPAKGLFRVEGDALTLCLVGQAAARPKKFEAPAGSKAMLITLKRVKKD
jgi:uncharacterized protein (TIGR03067 family)